MRTHTVVRVALYRVTWINPGEDRRTSLELVDEDLATIRRIADAIAETSAEDVRVEISAPWQPLEAFDHGTVPEEVTYHRYGEPDPTVCQRCRAGAPCPQADEDLVGRSPTGETP